MKAYQFAVYVTGHDTPFNLKVYKVRAPSEAIARGYCRGQCAINGWKIHDIRLLSE